MSNIVNLYTSSEEGQKNNLLNAKKAIETVWQDPEVIAALKEKTIEHISNMSSFDLTYETGFKERIMPSIFSDENIQSVLKARFIEYLNKDDINYDLGEALSEVLFNKLGGKYDRQ